MEGEENVRPSTKKAIDEATELLKEAGVSLSPAGFKYHSERVWLALTDGTDLDLLQLEIDKSGEWELYVRRHEYVEKVDRTGKRLKKGAKKNGG